MGFVLGQFNQAATEPMACSQTPASQYMTLIQQGTCRLKDTDEDRGVEGEFLGLFEEDCIEVPTMKQEPYYLHVKIKRLIDTSQTFKVILCNYSAVGAEKRTQQIKTITVGQGLENDWVDFQTVFTPMNGSFNCIIFQLVRIQADYINRPRRPLIIYQELSRVENAMPYINKDALGGMVKIGVQSHPGFMMCINGEEIHIGRSGQYEIKNGIITVNNFSVVAPAEEYGGNGLIWDDGQNVSLRQFQEELAKKYNEELDKLEGSNSHNAVPHMSRCIFGTAKKRKIDSFILDYLYEQKEKEGE